LNYVNQEGNVKNLFTVPKKEKVEERKVFKLFILLNLMAIYRNTKLYLACIASNGNELRLGGHEAPPRIISVFLGDSISAIIDGKEPEERQNLRDKMSYLDFDIKQEDTDRNRTSPYAYTGSKFEFRAVGSSQNPSFPMAVIAATLAK
jgi:glutamine synthetase